MKREFIIEDGVEYKVETNIYTQRWFDENNDFHRERGPALIYYEGKQIWYYHGKLHREDGPAIITAEGNQEWWVNGQRHRIGEPAFIRIEDGQRYEEWWVHDQCHRIDGPACYYPDTTIQHWYFQDQEVPVSSQEEFEQWLKLRAFT